MHLRQGELFLSLNVLLCRTALKMKQFFLKAIRFYRKHISPHLPPMCKYYPTCSCYAIEAIETHGAFKGGLLALYRLLRCNPLSAGGYDPVPPKKDKHKNCPHD